MADKAKDFIGKAKTTAEKAYTDTTAKLEPHAPYITGAVAGSAIAYQAIRDKNSRETVSERLRRYAQIALGCTIAAGSILADLYKNNAFNLQDRFEVGMPYLRRKPVTT